MMSEKIRTSLYERLAFYINGYLLVKHFLDKEECLSAVQAIESIKDQGVFDEQTPNSPAFYNFDKQIQQSFNQRILDAYKDVTQKDLAPSYSYGRYYLKDAVLYGHRDRLACEYSATVLLGHSEETSWPIYFTRGGERRYITMDVGDIVFYKGMDLIHGRDQFKGSWQLQAFYHYVDRDGICRLHENDNAQSNYETDEAFWEQTQMRSRNG